MSDRPSLSSHLHIPSEILHHDLQGEAVVLNLTSGVYFGLDALGARIWQLIREQSVLHKVVASLVDEYDVTEQECLHDVLALVAQMQENGLVEVVD
jgi:Coenzyme PQQ synthesis protein D (PqqD)